MEEEAEGEAETEEANAEGKAPGEGARGLALVLRVVVRIPEVNPMAVRTPPGAYSPPCGCLLAMGMQPPLLDHEHEHVSLSHLAEPWALGICVSRQLPDPREQQASLWGGPVCGRLLAGKLVLRVRTFTGFSYSF